MTELDVVYRRAAENTEEAQRIFHRTYFFIYCYELLSLRFLGVLCGSAVNYIGKGQGRGHEN